MKRAWRSTAAAASLVLGGLGLVACGSSGGSDGSPPGSGGATITTAFTLGTSGGSRGASGTAMGKVRVVNVFLRDGKAFGPIDLYDVPDPSEDAKPLIADLGYGEVSDYVSPKSLSDSASLYLFPAGSTTRDDDVDGVGGRGISNAGWKDGDQSTVVIGAAAGLADGDPTNLQYTEISESDDAVTWKPIAGKGEVLFNVSGAGVDSKAASVTAVIDDECPMRVDPENSPGGGQGIDTIANGNDTAHEVTPGSHDVGFLTADYDSSVTTCTAADALGKTSVDVAADSRVEVFIYGPTKDDLELVVAPVDEP